MHVFAALDVGATSIKAALVQADGMVLHQDSILTGAADGPKAVVEKICKTMSALEARYPGLRAIGVGMPGVFNRTDGCIYHPPNLPGWGVFPIRETLQRATRQAVFVDNDANVAGLGEAAIGAGRDCPDFLYVTLGTGIGGAIIHRGDIFTGERGGAAEIGHVIVHADATARPHQAGFRVGVLEEYAGRHALLNSVRAFAAEHPDKTRFRPGQDFDVRDISEAAYDEDPAALACFSEAGRLLGVALATSLNLLDMRIVIVGGGISQAHPSLLESARSELRQRALPSIASEAEIRPARFGKDAGIIGAAMLAKIGSDQS